MPKHEFVSRLPMHCQLKMNTFLCSAAYEPIDDWREINSTTCITNNTNQLEMRIDKRQIWAFHGVVSGRNSADKSEPTDFSVSSHLAGDPIAMHSRTAKLHRWIKKQPANGSRTNVHRITKNIVCYFLHDPERNHTAPNFIIDKQGARACRTCAESYEIESFIVLLCRQYGCPGHSSGGVAWTDP